MDNSPQNQNSQQKKPDLYREDIGTTVERFRSFERDVAKLKGIPLESTRAEETKMSYQDGNGQDVGVLETLHQETKRPINATEDGEEEPVDIEQKLKDTEGAAKIAANKEKPEEDVMDVEDELKKAEKIQLKQEKTQTKVPVAPPVPQVQKPQPIPEPVIIKETIVKRSSLMPPQDVRQPFARVAPSQNPVEQKPLPVPQPVIREQPVQPKIQPVPLPPQPVIVPPQKITPPVIPQPKPVPPPEPQRQPQVNKYEIAGKKESLSAGGNTFESLKAANTVVIDEKPKLSQQELAQELHKNHEDEVAATHTIHTDIAEKAHASQVTPETIMRAEEQRVQNLQPVTNTRRTVVIAFLSILLLAGGASAIYVIYKVRNQPVTPSPIENQLLLISFDRERNITIDRNQSLFDAVIGATTAEQKTATELIKLNIQEEANNNETVDGQRFAVLTSTTIPQWLVRSFATDYAAGLYTSTKGTHPFVIFKVTSQDTAYAGMLEWEKTMPNDFKTLYSQQNPTTQTTFKDVVIKNKDVRVLEDSAGRRLLFYSFADKETLIITTDQATLEEIFAPDSQRLSLYADALVGTSQAPCTGRCGVALLVELARIKQ